MCVALCLPLFPMCSPSFLVMCGLTRCKAHNAILNQRWLMPPTLPGNSVPFLSPTHIQGSWCLTHKLLIHISFYFPLLREMFPTQDHLIKQERNRETTSFSLPVLLTTEIMGFHGPYTLVELHKACQGTVCESADFWFRL